MKILMSIGRFKRAKHVITVNRKLKGDLVSKFAALIFPIFIGKGF